MTRTYKEKEQGKKQWKGQGNRKRKKKENKGQSDMGENNGANRKFPHYLLVKQETSPLCHVQKSQTQQRLICHVQAE